MFLEVFNFLMAKLAALLSRSGRALATFFNFYVSHSSTARF